MNAHRVRKNAYRTPTLERLGTVSELTRGGMQATDDAAGTNPAVSTATSGTGGS